MATTLEEILNKNIRTVKELKDEIKRLQDELVQTEIATEEWDSTSEKLGVAQERLNNVLKAGKQEMQGATGSIVAMEKEYRELYKTYKLLSEEDRNSEFGREMMSSLNDLSTKINEAKKNAGDFKNNIGRYSEGVTEAFNKMGISFNGLLSPLKLVNGGFTTLNATMKANPIGIILIALETLIALFNKVKDAIMGNEKSQMRLNVAMSAFQPIIDKTTNVLDKLAQKLVSLIEWGGKLFSKLRELKGAFTDFIGITEGEQERIAEENNLYAELTERQNALIKAKQEAKVLNAQQDAELKRLLDEAEATTDSAKKLELVNQAKELNNTITERNIKLAQEEYDIMLKQAELTPNSAEDNERLAEAKAKVAQAEAEGASRAKEMTSKITSLTTAIKQNKDAVDKDTSALDELLKRIYDREKSEKQKLEEQYKKDLELLGNNEQAKLLLKKQYNEDLKKLEDETQKKLLEKRKEYYSEQNSQLAIQYLNEINDINNKVYKSELTRKQDLIDAEQNYLMLRIGMLHSEMTEFATTEEEKFNYLQQIDELNQQYTNNELERNQILIDSQKELLAIKYENINAIISTINSIGNLTSAISQNIERTIQDGNITQEQAERKKKVLKNLEAAQLAISLASITSSTAKGIMDLWTAYAGKTVANNAYVLPPAIASANAIDLASTIAQTVGLATTASAQIAGAIGGYIANVKGLNASGGTSAVTPAQIDTTTYTYTRPLETQEEKEENNRPVVVYVSDIISAINKVEVRDKESTF